MKDKKLILLHLSDLHFGRIEAPILHDLQVYLDQRQAEIDLIILTGDMTQRAKVSEFKAARQFLTTLPSPLFLVPGNHDVPLFNLCERFLSPYKRFIKYLGPFSQQTYLDDHFAVFGLWTTDNFSAKSGKWISEDLKKMKIFFSSVGPEKIRIIAAHHPPQKIKSNLDKNWTYILRQDPHFILWGHEHVSSVHIPDEQKRFPILISAGTSTSSRLRAEANSFNVITFDLRRVRVETLIHHQQEGFQIQKCRVIDFPEGRSLPSGTNF
jgi:3',5'-cyclic AMP phosphodiesterase CpdA